MAWRYRDRETKKFVSSANYNRSVKQGGKRFERFSNTSWHSKGRPQSHSKRPKKISRVETSGKAAGTSVLKVPSSQSEYERMMEAKLQKLSKKKRAAFYDAEYDVEYETGVDY